MRIPVSWLREFVDARVAPAALADTLTMTGFEVAAMEEVRDDTVIDLEITANRPDCLSVLGIAREVATVYRLPLSGTPALRGGIETLATGSGGTTQPGNSRAEADGLTVQIEDAELCPRYAAAVADVKIAPSPQWLADRLVAAGVRPINNVVDVTNYVMIELGHPLHAFDLARLAGRTLRIRTAKPGEQVRTLDGELRSLDGEALVIADAEAAQAIAGVMGGATSEIWDGTTTVALESAYFKPASVRRTSKRTGLKTEASARFERGANIEAPVVALRRVLDLFEQIGTGTRRGGIIDCYPVPRKRARVSLRRSRIRHLLGHDIPDADVVRILGDLGFSPSAATDGWQVTVPGWRVDVTREADLIEEVARHHGYDRIPSTFPPLAAIPAPSDPRIERDAMLRRALAAGGFSEAISFVFIEDQAAAPFAPGAQPVALGYPLSEKFAVLRPSLLPGLLDAVTYNRRRERRDIRLFEIGSTFSAAEGEKRAVAAAWSGGSAPEHWSGPARPVDFFDMKGVVENLCSALGVPVTFVPAETPYLVEGKRAGVLCNEKRVGVLGQLSPALADARDMPAGEEIYVAELDLTILPVPGEREIVSQPPPRHPSSVRDLSILVARTLSAAAVRGTIVAAAPPTLVGVREFDRYQGKGVPEDRVSLSFHLTFRASERTLTDAEVQQAMDRIVEALVREHDAVRR